jgi:Iron only hydrogenase large subunit, C-terminal domain
MQMFASVLKELNKYESHKLFHVAVMPCTAKKFEADRDEFTMDGAANVDAVITTQELIRMIKESGVVFDELQPEAVDMPFGTVSGAGVIFGVTGGVTEAVLRRVTTDKSRASLLTISHLGERGADGVKEFDVPYGDRKLHIGVVSGLHNAERVIQRIKAGEHFDLVEVMACPGGCVSGAGQPFVSSDGKRDRTDGLYAADRVSNIRRSEENPLMTSLYDGILKGHVHELLHVHYNAGGTHCHD